MREREVIRNKILEAIHKPKAYRPPPTFVGEEGFYCSPDCFWYPKFGRTCKLFNKVLKNERELLLRCGKCVTYEK